MAASSVTEGGLIDEEGRDKGFPLGASWLSWPCVGCIGGRGHRQRVSRANSAMTVNGTAVKLHQYRVILQAIGKKRHLREHLKVASHQVWLHHVTFTKSVPVSRDTVPSSWPGLMPRSNTGVISNGSDTVCGGGWKPRKAHRWAQRP